MANGSAPIVSNPIRIIIDKIKLLIDNIFDISDVSEADIIECRLEKKINSLELRIDEIQSYIANQAKVSDQCRK